MSDDTIQITVDGTQLKARRGQMLIEVTDSAGIDIPRFCYHRKLSVAANCRMCLVEVEKAPKPLPACATPCMPDMVVHTTSTLARDAQRGTMEFLLINHPLDCPICDQGGECELQDVAMGYGNSASQYSEGKRVVLDKYIGPLIATEMTRCIHCTRCVRFGEEIAGVRELGATGRGEDMRIGTFVEKSVVSELSGNVIDICPVGALTARPSRFTARAWEMTRHASVSPHDCIGSNIHLHLDDGRVNRVVPRDNEAINEVWISDRDRFSYQGLNSEERVTTPMQRVDGRLEPCDWPTALQAASRALTQGGPGVLASASGSLEELYLSQKLCRALGSNHIDHRLGQCDFRAQDNAPVMPWLGMTLSDLETLDAALLIGSNIRKDQPIAALRLRKSAMKGAAISLLNPRHFPMHFRTLESISVRFDAMVQELAAMLSAAGGDPSAMPGLADPIVEERHHRIVDSLEKGERTAVFLGNLFAQHPDRACLDYLARQLAMACNATLSILPEHGNAAAAWLAGVVPHRLPGGVAVDSAQRGMNAREMLERGMPSWLLVGVEVELDAANPAQAMNTLAQSGNVVTISAYLSEGMRQVVDVVLPAAAFTETHATHVNACGSWQSSRGACAPPGQARPGWKILRVLAESLQLEGFGYDSPEEIAQELKARCDGIELNNLTSVDQIPEPCAPRSDSVLRAGETPIHAGDPVARRSRPLQKSLDGQQAFAVLSPRLAESLDVHEGDPVQLQQALEPVTLPARIDWQIPDGCVWVPMGLPDTAALGDLYGSIEVRRS